MAYPPTPSMVNLLSRYGAGGGERMKCEREEEAENDILRYTRARWMTRGARERSGGRIRKKRGSRGRKLGGGIESWLARVKEAGANEPSFTSAGR